MNNILKTALILLTLVAAFFLVGVLYWLFHCHCGDRFRHEPPGTKQGGEGNSAPLNVATAEPQHPRGKYPPLPMPKDREFNDDHPRIVPTGTQRGTISPSVQDSKLLKIEKNKQALGGAGDPVVVVQYNPQGTSANVGGTPPDPNAARNGNVIMLSYNTRVMLSTNGGTSYVELDPTTIFPSGPTKDAAGNLLDSGLCCDQIIRYVPGIDRFIWLMQFCGSGTSGCLSGVNKERIASASTQDIVNGAGATGWTYWDLTSATFNLGNTTMDYPDLAVGDNDLYFSADAVSQGLLVVRIPLNQIRDSQTINMGYTSPSDGTATDGSTAYGSHISQNPGDTVFWAGSPKNNQIRVFSMTESSNQYSSHDIDIASWPNSTITLNAPDGVDNFSFGWPGNAITGVTRRTSTEVWFAWNASSNANFKNAHVEVVEINTSNFTKIAQWQIWNDSYAFVDPYLATNGNSEVGVSLAWGAAGTNYMSNAVGILGDFIVWYPELSTASPVASQIRLGDYFSVSRNPGNPLLYDASGYATLKQPAPATGWFFDPYYIQFGRDSVANGGSSRIH
ncbi:MAG: hypothetical protein ACREIF_08670 [Chthoniobacterales bacterium]